MSKVYIELNKLRFWHEHKNQTQTKSKAFNELTMKRIRMKMYNLWAHMRHFPSRFIFIRKCMQIDLSTRFNFFVFVSVNLVNSKRQVHPTKAPSQFNFKDCNGIVERSGNHALHVNFQMKYSH